MAWKYLYLVRKRVQQAGRACIFLLVSMAVLEGCGDKRAAPLPVLQEGRPFPEIVLNFSGGKPVSTQSFRGKLVILNFWATWCPPCRREMPSLEQLSRGLDPDRFVVIGMSADEDALLAEEFLRQNGVTFANFFDRGGAIAKRLGLQVYPETMLIGPDGILLQRIPGLRDWSSPAMIAQLEELRRHGSAGGSPNNGKRQ